MKTTRLNKLAMLALAGLGFGIGSLKAAPNSADGEVLVGFRATGGSGSSTNYVIDLGQIADLNALSAVQTFPLTGVSTDLAAIYGAGWFARTDIFWGAVVGIGNAVPVGSDPARTLYATKPEVTNGVQASPWIRKSSAAHGTVGSKISALRGRFNLSTAATNAPADTAVTMSTGDLNSWSFYQAGGENTISFGLWGNQIDANPATYLDLFRMEVGSGDPPGTLVGRMILNSNASITFIPASVVGVNSLQFSSATYSAAENVGTGVLNVTINRTGDTSSASTINISTTEGTATDPEDFTAITNQAVTFAATETTKVVPITIINRSGDQGDRNFTVTLSGASGGTTIGAQGTATATITEASLPSQVAFAQSTFTSNQGDGSVTVQLVRTGGADSVSVTLSAVAGTATAGTDYTAPSGPSATITFGSNATTASGTITLLPRAAVTQHLEFNVSIASGGANPTVISPSTALVRILVADTNKPTVTIGATTPSATVLENPSDTVPVSGVASDDKTIIDRVEVTINGALVPVNATLTPSATSTNYSLTANQARGLKGGSNTVKVQAFDAKGNASLAVTKTFTYSVKRTLAPVASPNATAGTITGGTAAEVGKAFTLKAVAKPGFIFDHWTMTGVTGAPTELATLNVTLTDTMAATFTSTSANAVPVTAVFIANPFVANVIGKFQGLAIADGSSTPSNSTNGFINLDLTAAGTFTGTLSIDGFALSISGAFDNTGVAKFGAARTTTLLVARTNKPSYELALQLSPSLPVASPDGSQTITGTLKQKYRSALISNSVVTLRRSFYSATNPVTGTPLLNKGLYNIALPAETQTTLTDKHDYPQGSGFGTVTVTSLGAVNLASTLADGTTKVTAAGYLSKSNIAPLYTQLYTLKAGSLGGLVTVDGTQTDTDVAGADFFWFRPWQNVQYYPWGWPEGIKVDLIGTKLKTTPYTAAAAIIPSLPLSANNATLTFNDGLLSGLFDTTKDLTITHPTGTSTLVTNFPVTDTSFTLTVNTTAATFAGDFAHSDGTRPKFSGAILQKGANSKGFGFFQTLAPKVIDGTGETGGVILSHK